MEQLLPIEKPGKSGSIGAHRTEGGAFEHKESKKTNKEDKKERKFGWSLGVSEKPVVKNEGEDRSKYLGSLSKIKDKASGINTKYRDSVVKPWDFNAVRSDPSQSQYGNALANLKNNVKEKG
ncbi:MAG: hypothetical protein WCX30_00610 [Candidatus Paceibacterota bacterium]|jgi:hypothetical protein|nr:hypothetical protein [bacterium]